MENGMAASARRKKLISLLGESDLPLSGAKLGSRTGVSRQIVVQDIALLRAEGYPIVSTARGYLLEQRRQALRVFKVCHTDEQAEDELTTITDFGGRVLDVMVNHRIYGKVTAPLDIRRFVDDLQSGRSTLLLNVTSGYHFHTVSAEREEMLDEIEEALRGKQYLAELLPYEIEKNQTEL